MMRHVTIMLKLVADGLIVKPRAPPIPEMQDRPRAGDVTLGGNTILADKMTQLRQKWRQYMYMAAAEHNPEKYSKVVSIPAQDQGLVGKKIEVRMQMEEEVHVEGSDGEESTLVNKYLHCFEGTIDSLS
jgi:hypothetical protein